MMRSKLEIYALAVCFAAVVCLVISISIAGYSIIEITSPTLTIESYKYDYCQSNDSFWERTGSRETGKDEGKRPSEDNLTKQRQEALLTALKGEKREGLQTLVKTAMFIVMGGIALLIHAQIAKKARTERA